MLEEEKEEKELLYFFCFSRDTFCDGRMDEMQAAILFQRLEARMQRIRNQILVHAHLCGGTCGRPLCHRLTSKVRHATHCGGRTADGEICPLCTEVYWLCWHHAQNCNTNSCGVFLCRRLKSGLAHRRICAGG